MDAMAFFLTRYEDLHGRSTDDLLAGLGDEQLRRRPHPAVNTIAWLLWHVARIEDVSANRLIAGRPQVLDDEGWLERLGIARRDVGTGMDDAEVDDLSRRIDLAALRGYSAAVGRRTLALARALRAEDLDGVVTAEAVRRVCLDEGAAGDKAGVLATFWAGKTRGWLLAQTVLVHGFGHIYEGRAVKGLWGIRGL